MIKRKNIVLIGMPSSGKSTVGRPLAEFLKMKFIDTDRKIREVSGKPLRDIVQEDGLEAFLEIQEKTILGINSENSVISTGGSVVYSSRTMEYLAEGGMIVYLKNSLETLEGRITPERRLARSNGQTYAQLYDERTLLYEKYAHETIECDGKSVEEIVDEITGLWKKKAICSQ